MSSQQQTRLAAVLALDVVGYSRMMGTNEQRTLARLLDRRERVIDPTVTDHRGHVVKGTGDGILAEFTSAQDAIAAAIAIQAGLARANLAEADEQPMLARVGINVGDVIFHETGDIFGDGVNIAARLEAAAPAGGICVSGRALAELKRTGIGYQDHGELALKNIAEPVRIYLISAAAIGRPSGVSFKPSWRDQVPAFFARWRRRQRLLALTTVLLIVAALALFLLGPLSGAHQATLRVDQLQAPPGDAAAQLVVHGFAPDLAQIVASTDAFVKVVDATEGSADAKSVDFSLSGSASSLGDNLHLSLSLKSVADGTIIWSTELVRPIAEAEAIHREAQVKVGGVVVCAINKDSGDRAVLNLDALKIYLQACELLPGGNSLRARELLRQLTTQAPRFIPGWNLLAIWNGFVANQSVGAELKSARAETLDAAKRALALQPDGAEPWVARALVAENQGDWPAAERADRTALQRSANDPFANFVYADLLQYVGRLNEAVPFAVRAASNGPLFAPKTALVIRLLADTGSVDEAADQLAAAITTWPDDKVLAWHKLTFESRYGNPSKAITTLRALHPKDSREAELIQQRLIIYEAQADPSPARTAAALAFIAAQEDGEHAGRGVVDLALLGQIDKVYDMIARNPEPFAGSVTQFFSPYMAKVRADRRFPALMRSAGLIATWKASGKLPDFCATPGLPYDCRTFS